MNELEQARQIINQTDEKIAQLFTQRMEAVRQVAAYKQKHGLPVLDAKREQELIKANAARVADPQLQPYYVGFLQDVMKHSRAFQEALLEGIKVAFCGVQGAFASIAARKIFPHSCQCPYPSFEAAYQAVVNGECDLAVLPLENSTAGEVVQVMDMLFNGNLFVTGIYDLPIRHHLLGRPDAHRSQIRQVISHPQALAQCENYIKQHGFTQITCENTAVAAMQVAQGSDSTVAAIASQDTAQLYGLKVLDSNINQESLNTTRFAVLSRCLSQNVGKDKHSVLMFTVRNEAGSLAEAVRIIGDEGFNMRCLRSRPMKDLLWQYYFYVEVEGDLLSPKGQEMLEKLKKCCERLKHLGSFDYPAILH